MLNKEQRELLLKINNEQFIPIAEDDAPQELINDLNFLAARGYIVQFSARQYSIKHVSERSIKIFSSKQEKDDTEMGLDTNKDNDLNDDMQKIISCYVTDIGREFIKKTTTNI